MDSKLRPFLLILATTFPFVCLPSATGIGAAHHNITRLLAQFPDFGTFNSLLSRSHIAREINRRETITVLALDNSAAGAISGLPEDTLAHVLSVHVILDYYDQTKIRLLKRRSTLFTTLFQTTGVADDRMGFLNFTRLGDGLAAFGSAVPGSSLVATLVKEVATKPYSLSVLQVSGAIVPQGISDEPLAPFGSAVVVKPGRAAAPAPRPAEAPEKEAPANAPEAEAPSPAPEGDSPAPAQDGDAPGPAASDVAPSAEDDDYEDDSAPGERAAGAVGVLAAAGVALLSLC